MTVNVFTKSIGDLRRWQVGEPVYARKLNRSVDTLNALVRGVASPRQTPINPQGGQEPGGFVRLTFRILGYNELICDTLDGESLVVAKPWQLQRTPFAGVSWGGVTYTFVSPSQRLAFKGETEETQVIIPRYLPGQTIYAQHGTTEYVNTQAFSSGEPLTLIDINQSGRAWARRRDA